MPAGASRVSHAPSPHRPPHFASHHSHSNFEVSPPALREPELLSAPASSAFQGLPTHFNAFLMRVAHSFAVLDEEIVENLLSDTLLLFV